MLYYLINIKSIPKKVKKANTLIIEKVIPNITFKNPHNNDKTKYNAIIHNIISIITSPLKL